MSKLNTNDWCPRCEYADCSLTAWPCRTCAIANSTAVHFKPKEPAEGETVSVESMLEIVADKSEVYHNCTVQVLTNSKTGQTSIAWTQNPETAAAWEAEEYEQE